MARISGSELGQQLCKALGLDSGFCVSIVIEASVHRAARITIERLVQNDEIGEMAKILEEYNLVKKDEIDEEAWRLLVEDDCALPLGDEAGSRGALNERSPKDSSLSG